jgi:protoheme IX farnesyltransferase
VSASTLLTTRGSWNDYLELTKPRITLMVVLTALLGFVLGSVGPLDKGILAWTLLGTGLVAAGASTLNMLLESETDGLMARTRNRPLPSGRLHPPEVLFFGLAVTILGLVALDVSCGLLTAAVALLTWATYLFWYTPLKTRTSLATLVGAIPGALPPVIGWAAARGTIDSGAGVLFAILYLWQIPHFLAIASLYKEDYALGGLPMLPVVDRTGGLTGRQMVIHSVGLSLASLLPGLVGMAGPWYLAGAALLGVALTIAAGAAAVRRTAPAARTLFLTSVLYLAALSALLLIDRR